MHLSNDSLVDCVKCSQSGSLSRILGKPHIRKTQNIETDPTDGNLTKKFIEENREILNQQKKKQ